MAQNQATNGAGFEAPSRIKEVYWSTYLHVPSGKTYRQIDPGTGNNWQEIGIDGTGVAGGGGGGTGDGNGIYSGSGAMMSGVTTVTMPADGKLQFDSANGPVTGLFTVDGVTNRIGFGTDTPLYGAHFKTGDLFIDQGNAAIGATPPAPGFKMILATDDTDLANSRGMRIVLGDSAVGAAAAIIGAEIRTLNTKVAAGVNNYNGWNVTFAGGATQGIYNMVGGRIRLNDFADLGTATITKHFFELTDGVSEGLGKVLADVSGTGLTSWVDPSTLISTAPLTDVLTAGNTTADGQVITALNGNGTLTLRDGADNIVAVQANGDYTQGWLYADTGSASAGFGANNYVYADSKEVSLYLGNSAIKIYDNTGTPTPASVADQKPSIISNFGGVVNMSINNTVLVGGSNTIGKTADTAYVNQVGWNAGGGFETLMVHTTATADRTVTLPNADMNFETATTGTLTFGGGGSGDIATLDVANGIITGFTTVP